MEVVLLLTLGSIVTAVAFVALTTLLGVVWARMRYYKALVLGKDPEEVPESPSFSDRMQPAIESFARQGRRFLAVTFETVWKTCVVVVTAIAVGSGVAIMYRVLDVWGLF